MAADPHVEALMHKLLRAVEVSLAAAEAARDAVHEIVKRGVQTGAFFAGTQNDRTSLELTPEDREFLRAVSIRPDPQ